MVMMSDLFAKALEKIIRRWPLWLAAAVILLAFIYWHQYRGWRETDALIGRLRESAATSERRADAVVDATRRREVTARETARKKTADLPDDQLVAALERMLVEYRKDR